ncbi:serine hydrolase domain-containing protein [Actinocorallia sp. A-T 12471]|uniref:serine hydrolase domain-containing protein n=1 Tax=Actinocorallia sp. A-T 12471 TaxID=3089813 RepID=UPI0029D0BF7F|nr:serine hydrolase domain-containing protein [Actinocorallia sp. A-T 12471]MDX6740749.1 serine hydrolase domain-containing protein [Actinocorallia sp. A-T 12471]
MGRGAGRRRAVAVAVVLLLAAQGCASGARMDAFQMARSPSATPSPLDTGTTRRLDEAVKGVMHVANVPGVIVGFWRPGSDPYVRAFGVADKDDNTPMRPGLHMRIGSVTKTFTVTAVLQLVDDGKIGLDDPISKYVSGVPDGDGITVRQLAEMRSGLFSYTEDPQWEKDMLANPMRAWTPRELLKYAFDHPPVFAPGAKFQYSNTNTILLGLAVEKVSGRELHEYLTTEVIEPSGLKDTTFPTDASFPEPHAQGYTAQDEQGKIVNATDWNPSWAWAAGAMTSTLDDMKKWAPVLAKGTLLKPATQAARVNAPSVGISGLRYGLGIFDDNGWLGHNGSLPGYQTVVVQLPEQEATLVVLANTDIPHDGNEVSTLFAQAITSITTPDHVYTLPAASTSPAASPAPSPTTPRSFNTPTPLAPATTLPPPAHPTLPATPGG